MSIFIIHYKTEAKDRDDEVECREYFRIEEPSWVPFYPHTVITDQVTEDTRAGGHLGSYDSSWQCWLALDRKTRRQALDDGNEIITQWLEDHGKKRQYLTMDCNMEALPCCIKAQQEYYRGCLAISVDESVKAYCCGRLDALANVLVEIEYHAIEGMRTK
jgi:hypothetical protein